MTRQANRTALKIASDTEKIGQAQVRAYLSIKAIALGLSENRNPIFGVVVHNSGQSPARFTHVVCEIMGNTPLHLESSDRVYIGPSPVGEIRAGENSRPDIEQSLSKTVPLLIGTKKSYGTEFLIVTIGVFAIDVFGKEITCFEGAAVTCKLGGPVNFTGTWTAFAKDSPSLAEERLRAKAWTGFFYAEKKPKERA